MIVTFLECVLHGVHDQKRVHRTIEKEKVELATRSACITLGGVKVRVPPKVHASHRL